jgi:biopolymer transport protein ExbD
MRVKRPAEPVKMQPPMTPMIDCVFNLLIFFLLTPSFSMTEGYLTTNLPTTQGPNPNKPQIQEVSLKIELYDVGPNGIFVDGGKNEFCSITFNESTNLAGNFDALYQALDEKRKSGLSDKTPVLISPTMGCRHKWVVKAFDAVVAAKFSAIHFAVPYE